MIHVTKLAVVVMDGDRLVAKARCFRPGQLWVLRAYGFSWFPRPAPTRVGAQFDFLTVARHKRDALKILSAVNQQES